MTVIAWDGKTLAADKLTSDNGVAWISTKIERAPNGALLGSAGTASSGRALKQWWIAGAKPEEFPKDEKDATLLVITPDRKILMYWQSNYSFNIENERAAIGSGRDFALAAMHLGRTAIEAVEVACALDINCGNGIDTLALE